MVEAPIEATLIVHEVIVAALGVTNADVGVIVDTINITITMPTVSEEWDRARKKKKRETRRGDSNRIPL